MESYYLFSNGRLARKDNVVRMEATDGRYKDLKIELIRDLYLFGEVDTNTKCLNYLAQKEVPVHFFNYYGFYTGSFYPKESNVSGTLLVKQVASVIDKKRQLRLAQQFVAGATANILRNLRYYKQRGRDIETSIDSIKSLEKLIPRANAVSELMGIEGDIHKYYYGCWEEILNHKYEFTTRVRRPPDNIVNTLISFVNTMVYTACLSQIYVTQLNPTVSFLHVPSERRFSLSLDISEIFKPLISDRLIFSLLNKQIITATDFENGSNGLFLKRTGQTKIITEFDKYLKTTVRHRDLKRSVSYRHLIRLECYKLIKDLMGEKAYEPFVIWW
ncbi:type I-B CRISPR-associated endonuclease Cas1b [Agrilactobacillus fermenti]|uniref:type I-B CRISPR-associated endonuclease Cas1b n=1 Tax=Agrilactobacillus fermenti TaxID=2586909 RepID=UPI001E4C3CC3|nr:type I-B CRISPR-associated endonuclease Cas1b [Agrilactobacillus fermenti]MCD2257197.1 type I-B CRISPR-associated endonuclease Cas1 [Agrilactobacillus fermenti]